MAGDGLSLSLSRALANRAADRFSTAMAVYLAIQAVAGVLAILFGGDMAEAVELDESPGLVRVIGGLTLLLALLSVPAYMRPVRSRATVLAVLAGGYVLGFLWLAAGAGLLWVGVIQLVFAVGLSVLALRFFVLELQSRP